MAWQHPAWDPVIVQLGPLAIHWYGFMYLLAWGIVYQGVAFRIRRQELHWSLDDWRDLMTWGMLGVILGGRIGYLAVYQPDVWWQDPGLVWRIWQGGMSFHGGLVGVCVAVWYFSRRMGLSPWAVTDAVAPWVPWGLACGRFGNFINGELWGRVSDVPWAMVFPWAGPEPRHPSPLYECALEGILLGVLLGVYARCQPPERALSAAFLSGYGTMRFISEYFREPDAQWGFLWGGLTMGQYLSLPMIALGAAWWYAVRRRTV